MTDNHSTVLSLRVSPELAARFKMEAARRNMRLNRLFEEMFDTYQKETKSRPDREQGRDNG